MDGGRRPSELKYYGKLRSRDAILPEKLAGVLDYSPGCGWHECHDRYFIRREKPEELIDNYLLLFTVDGEGEAAVDGVGYRLVRNTAMIFPKRVRHMYRVPRGGRWEFYWAHLEGPNCDALLEYMLREYGPCFEITCREKVTDYIELLIETEYRYYEYELFAAQMISRMLYALVEDMGTPSRDAQQRKTLTVKVIEYIEAHFDEPLQLGDISAQLYLSTEHIIRTFREETGMTPYQYIKRYRLRRACTCLEESDMSIAGVAAAVGYQSASSFIAQFRDYYGITPRTYRKFCAGHIPIEFESGGIP